MSDRHSGYLVALEEDIHEDDSKSLMEAMKQLRGVIAVIPVKGDSAMSIAEARAKHDIYNRLWEVIR